MAKPIRFTPKKCPSGWRLNIPPKLSETGKRQQFFYRTQKLALAAAVEFKRKLDDFGAQAMAIPPSVAEQATAAKALLEPYGITILQAAQRVAEIEKTKNASVTVKEAVAAFTLAKEFLSTKQTQAISHMGNHLIAKFSDRKLSTITAAEIESHIEEHSTGASAFNAKVRLHRTMWRWCANEKRGWCEKSALASIERQTEKPKPIGVLSAAQAEALLDTAETHLPDCVIPFAIALITGMRPSEIRRLSPEDITEDGLHVTSSTDRKNNRRRFIQMPDNFAKWLKAYPLTESVCPANFSRKEKAVRRLAGFSVWSDFVVKMGFDPPMPAEPGLDTVEWPHNALRHTAASVAVALKKPLQDLLFEHGHTGGEDTLKRHYLGKMTKREAEKIWQLAPKKSV
jgi:integrase